MSRVAACVAAAVLPLVIAFGCEPLEVRIKPAPSPPGDEFLPLSEVQRVALGRDDLCLAMREGTVRCMHDGVLVPVPTATDVVEIAVGDHHACALTKTGAVICWGRNELGEVPGPVGSIRGARAVALPAAAVEIRVGKTDSCARLATGSVVCWGAVGGTKNAPPTSIGWLSNAVGFALSESALCALTSTHVLSCSLGGALNLHPVGDDVHVSQVALGRSSGCALLDDGTVRCFTLFPPSTAADTPLLPWAEPVGITDVVQLAAGNGHTCARRRDGSVRCWGTNDHGQLGNGSRAASKTPVPVADLGDAIELSAGGDRTCVQRSTRSVECWGADSLADTTFGSAKPGERVPVGPNDSLVPSELRVPVAFDAPAVLFSPATGSSP